MLALGDKLTKLPIHRVCLAADIHFDVHHPALWASFCEWHKEYKPTLTVLMGDIVDLGMVSKYTQEGNAPVNAISQIQIAVEAINNIARQAGRVILMLGNHEDRWDKTIVGDNSPALAGAKGLSIEAQFYAQGLSPGVQWYREGKDFPGLVIGKRAIILQHGHKGFASKAGGRHLASAQLAQISTMSSARGHYHRAQMMCRTELGKTIFGLALPHMSATHEYAGGNPDWHRGFAELQFYGRSRLRDCERFTPNLIIADEQGRFAYGGRVYG
jgi:predicted phosphodiesterase